MMPSDLFPLFSPYTMEKLENLKRNNSKFVHYTGAATGLEIIKKKCVWMRSSLVMNDFQEVEHGQRCVKQAWNDDVWGVRIKAALHRIDSTIWDRVCQLYDDSDIHQRNQSYLISVSEHGHGSLNEDKYGRLSMWRAYGGDTNVALVLNNGPFTSETTALSAYTSPVLYADADQFKLEFSRVVQNIEQNIELISAETPEFVAEILYNALYFASLSTKHPGFSEEREWRVLHSPTLFPSERISFDVETIGGVPQKVYKLPLKNIPDEGLSGIEISELLSEVIIGPTQYPWPIYDAYYVALENAGIKNPNERIRVSGIPLRK